FVITYAKVPGIRPSTVNDTYTYELTDVNASLADGTQDGWLGAYGDPGASLLTPGTADVILEASTQTTLANGFGRPEDPPRPADMEQPRRLRDGRAPRRRARLLRRVEPDGPRQGPLHERDHGGRDDRGAARRRPRDPRRPLVDERARLQHERALRPRAMDLR